MASPVPVQSPVSILLWLLALLLAVGVYVFGLGGQYIPSNGDEMVYAHIARVTAETGNWLPLASELEGTRNTKPPVLFWQAMVAGNWGLNWSLAAIRAPSIIYIFLTAAAVGWSVFLIRRNGVDALTGICIYLAFLSTFRYGRPFLTSAPETFWLSLPLWALLWQRLNSKPAHGWISHGLFGLALGIGLAYKSFALIAPAAAAWGLALLLSTHGKSVLTTLKISARVTFSACIALAVFGLWFALDPDPASVWQEFVVAENASKFKDSRGYWSEALTGGGSSMWAQLLAFAVNAGLLAFVVIGLAAHGIRRLFQSRPAQPFPDHLLILLAWAGVWLLVFTLPSQRSARYVIPAMPAVAVLLALYWRHIARYWFVPTLLLSALVLVMFSRIAWVGFTLDLHTPLEIAWVMVSAFLGLTAVVLGLCKGSWLRPSALWACLLVYANFNLTVAPLDGAIGRYSPEAAATLDNKRIAVPNGFNSQFERFQFLLPGKHTFVPYDTEGRALGRLAPGASLPKPAELANELLKDFDAIIWIQSNPTEVQPLCLPNCRILGSRWQLKSRYLSGEIHLGNLWQPQDWLFRREWLLTRASPAAP